MHDRDRTDQFCRAMVGMIGHDLRAPMAAILLGTEILVAQHQNDPALAVIERIASFANRMTGMVDQLLDLTRLQLGGGIALARCKMQLEPVIQSVVGELARKYPRNQFSVAGEREIAGVWDLDRLRQVTASLVANAVQHGLEDGAIDIVIGQNERSTTIAVHNDVRGEPISAEAIEALFEPYQPHAGTGLGLGLYIVREIVGAHDGSVVVESDASGTTFRVILPGGK